MSWLIMGSSALPLAAATSSEWYARTWQTEDGLPEHTIVALEQTSDGYLWLATHSRGELGLPAPCANQIGSPKADLLIS